MLDGQIWGLSRDVGFQLNTNAERLGLSVRQVERWVLWYRSEGPVGLISRHRHRTGNRALKPSVAEQVVPNLHEQYADFGPTLAAEKPASRQQIVIAQETVRQLLSLASIPTSVSG